MWVMPKQEVVEYDFEVVHYTFNSGLGAQTVKKKPVMYNHPINLNHVHSIKREDNESITGNNAFYYIIIYEGKHTNKHYFKTKEERDERRFTSIDGFKDNTDYILVTDKGSYVIMKCGERISAHPMYTLKYCLQRVDDGSWVEIT